MCASRGQRTVIQGYTIIERQNACVAGVKVPGSYVAVPFEVSCPDNSFGYTKYLRKLLDHLKVIATANGLRWDLEAATHEDKAHLGILTAYNPKRPQQGLHPLPRVDIAPVD